MENILKAQSKGESITEGTSTCQRFARGLNLARRRARLQVASGDYSKTRWPEVRDKHTRQMRKKCRSNSQHQEGLVWGQVQLSRSVVSNSVQPHGLQPARLLCPWNSPGKDTGVGGHSYGLNLETPREAHGTMGGAASTPSRAVQTRKESEFNRMKITWIVRSWDI